MNYYIQGDAANADKIRAAFESKGIRVPHFRSCGDSSLIYFSLNKEVLAVTIKALELFKNNPDYQELELPIEPCFKVGDDIKTGNTIDTVAEVDHATHRYYCESGRTISFENQDLWHLAPKSHYDIKNFHVGMPVLVRNYNNNQWEFTFFGRYQKDKEYPFRCADGYTHIQCIPYEGNEALLGTTDMCDEQFINW